MRSVGQPKSRHCSVICLCSDFKQVAKSILPTRNRSAVKQIFKIVASCLRFELISGWIHLGRTAAPNRIIAAAEGQYKTLYWIAAETGMRPGELCGLAVSDLNLANLTIRIRHSVWGGQLQTPKTANALRNLAISPQLAEHLSGYLSQWSSNPMGLRFLSTVGKPLHPSCVRRDHLEPLCKSLGIQPKGMRAFRHCSASMMDQAGVPLKVRQERLGHAPGSKVTMVHYTHSVSEDGRIAAAKMGELLSAAV